MLIALTFLFISFRQEAAYQKALTQTSGSASAIMRALGTLVTPADAVLATHTFASGVHTSSATTLVLELPAVDASGATIQNAYDYAAVYAVGEQVYCLIEASGGSARISGTTELSATTHTLTFTYDASDFANVTAVTASVITDSIVGGTTLSDRRQEYFRLRNH